MKQVVGRRIIGNENVHASVIVEIGGDNSEPPSVVLEDTRFFRDVDELSAIVAKEMVGQRFDFAGVARDEEPLGGVLAEEWVLGVPDAVMTDVQIEVPIAVEVR